MWSIWSYHTLLVARKWYSYFGKVFSSFWEVKQKLTISLSFSTSRYLVTQEKWSICLWRCSLKLYYSNPQTGSSASLLRASQVALVVKNLLASAGRRMRHRFDPWVGRIPWRRVQQPTPVFLPGESHGQRSLVAYCPWGRKESATTEVT